VPGINGLRGQDPVSGQQQTQQQDKQFVDQIFAWQSGYPMVFWLDMQKTATDHPLFT
jgi:hypothetical protein